MSADTNSDKKDLQDVVVSRKISRRTLLKGFTGLAALGVLMPACQAGQQQPAPQASPTVLPKPTPPSSAATPASSASPAAKQIALPKVRPMKICWTSATGTMAGVWMAHETGAWKEMGIDSELVHIASSSRAVAALETREVEGSVFDWVVAFTSFAAGANGRIVAALVNRMILTVFGTNGVTKPADVKGKRFGITRVSSTTHSAALLALDQWGMKPSDVNFVSLGEVQGILAGLQAGQVDVGVVSPPTSTRAAKAGFPKLINLAEEGPDYPAVGLATTKELIDGSPDAVLAFVAGYSLGLKRFRSDRERSLQVLKKYLQTDNEELITDTYDQYARYLAWPPVVPIKAAERVLQDAAKIEPKVNGIKVEQVATNQFVEELQKRGFFS